jgi:hypothetical protein
MARPPDVRNEGSRRAPLINCQRDTKSPREAPLDCRGSRWSACLFVRSELPVLKRLRRITDRGVFHVKHFLPATRGLYSPIESQLT